MEGCHRKVNIVLFFFFLKSCEFVQTGDKYKATDVFRVLGEWPNTYTFTKAIGESIVAEEAKELPFAIFRPSIGNYVSHIYVTENQIEETTDWLIYIKKLFRKITCCKQP